MKEIFDHVSYECSKLVTSNYSTSFSLAVRTLSPKIRKSILAIYGFVRFADEIVDSFHGYDQETLLNQFEKDLNMALEHKVSLNPILNAFQDVVHRFQIERGLIDAFLKSMRADLHKESYDTISDYEGYIYGSADVVGLMCLKVFVDGDTDEYERLKYPAMKLGSAFQKVNFLRDLKQDMETLHRSYFPHLHGAKLDNETKTEIIKEIEEDFKEALSGIKQLPVEAKFGVYTAYIYYGQLLKKLKKINAEEIQTKRIRISNPLKIGLLAKSFLRYKFNQV